MMFTFDGATVEADTPEDLVRAMHALSYARAANDAAWMETTAKSTWQVTGHTIRWGTAADFVADMMAAGLVAEGKKNANHE